jgi:hypothetical protein
MRMPFTEFITNGDLKFMAIFIIFIAIAIYHFIKKIQSKNNIENQQLENHYNTRIGMTAFWILILSALSLFLGLMHSFYFIGKAGGIAPNLIFKGISYTLITPIFGISLFIICKILEGNFNSKISKSK